MNSYKPNNSLYLPLLLIAVSVTLSALGIETSNPWFAVVSGVGCGGIASVIVAWLIDAANCREKGERSKAIYSIPWAELSLLAYSFSVFYKVLSDEKPDANKNKFTWLEWKDMLVSKLNETPNEKLSEKYKEVYDINTRGVVEQLKYISDKRYQLMADGLMSEGLFYSLESIKKKLELCRTAIIYSKCKDAAYWFSSLAYSLDCFFEKDKEFKQYKDFKFYDLVDFVEDFEKKAKHDRRKDNG